MQKTAEKRGYTTREAARYTGVSDSYLRKGRMEEFADKADVPRHIYITPRKAIYLREDLDAWLDDRAEASAQCKTKREVAQ